MRADDAILNFLVTSREESLGRSNPNIDSYFVSSCYGDFLLPAGEFYESAKVLSALRNKRRKEDFVSSRIFAAAPRSGTDDICISHYSDGAPRKLSDGHRDRKWN